MMLAVSTSMAGQRGSPNRRCVLTGLGASAAMMLAGCGRAPPTAKEALLAAKAFVGALLLLEEASKVFRTDVSSTVAMTKRNLGRTDSAGKSIVDLPQLAVDWEERWKGVHEKTGELDKQFKEVKIKSDEYWSVLEEITKAVADDALRREESKKNDEAKKKWDAAYQAAAINLSKAAALRDKGDDLQRIMLAAALRRQLSEYTVTLDSIAEEADRLLRSLEVLTQQGRSIVTLIQQST